MRGIGWLNLVDDEGNVEELLNDLRFLKRASTEGIVTRSMEDADLCAVYNYRFASCPDSAEAEPTEATNSVWQVTPADGDGGNGFFPQFGGTQGPVMIFNDDDNATIQAKLETLYGSGNVTVNAGPFPGFIYVEFLGLYENEDPSFSFSDPIGGDPDFLQITIGSPAISGGANFDVIDWGSPDPWVNPGSAAAQEFLGVWTDAWEGLEGEFDRTANARGWSFGGANFTPLRPKHLTMTFDVILGAVSERGLQYGFRWLSAMLRGVDECASNDLVVFDHCPPADVPAEWIFWTIRDAGVLVMPQWGEIIMEKKNCILRRVTFVLGARDPHKYRCPVLCTAPFTYEELPAPGTACAPDYSWSEWFCNTTIDGVGCEFNPPTFDYNSRAAIIHITSGMDGAPPMDIFFADDDGEIGTFRTTTLPPATELVIDSSRHRILTRTGDPLSAAPWVDGSQYVAAATGLAPVWAEVGPLGLHSLIGVTPTRLCGLIGTTIWIETVDRV